jgi:cytosine/adenosine deaminase-related metal-dependent hydrolase
MKFLADNRIRLNICPTSNALLGLVESLTEHPIRKLYDAGVKVTDGSLTSHLDHGCVKRLRRYDSAIESAAGGWA